MALPVVKKHKREPRAAHSEELAVSGGLLTWHGVLCALVSVCSPNGGPAAAADCTLSGAGAKVKEDTAEKWGVQAKKELVDLDDEAVALPALQPNEQGEGLLVPMSTSLQPTAVTPDSALVNGASSTAASDLTQEVTLLLLGDCKTTGPRSKVAVESVLAVSLVEHLPVFHELSLAPSNRICMLDLRLLEGPQKRLCVRSLSRRVSVNGKPVRDKWQPLAEGDALGLGHADGADRDARTVYAVTYSLREEERKHAMALAFARDTLAEYEIELPPGAVEEAGVPELVCQRPESNRGAGTADAWEARAKRAHDELLAVGAVARAIIDTGRRYFMEWAKDEAAAHGVSFGSRTEKALSSVGVAIAKCYEDSGFTLPPAMYWAVEGLVKCNEVMQREAVRAGELDLAASKLLQFVVNAAVKEGHVLDPETTDRIVQHLVDEFDEERQLDPESPLQSVVNRIWRDFGKAEVQSFVRGSAKWTQFHLDVRGRLTHMSKKAHFAETLSEFLHCLTESRGRHLSVDVLNHALSLALARGDASAIETVLSVYRVRGEVDAGTFRAWLLQAQRSSSWSSIAELMTDSVLAMGHMPLLTQALVDFARSLRVSSSMPAKSLALAQEAVATEATPLDAGDDLKELDDQASSGDDIAQSDDGDADGQDDELLDEADGDAEFLDEADGDADQQDEQLMKEADGGGVNQQEAPPVKEADECVDQQDEQLLREDVDWQDDEVPEADGDTTRQEEQVSKEAGEERNEEGDIVFDEPLGEEEQEEDFESGELSDDLAHEEDRSSDTAKAHNQRSWHWLAATSEKLLSQLARPRAAKGLLQEIRSASRTDDRGAFCMHWEQALVFDDCPPLAGFRRERDLKRALRDPPLQHLQLLSVDSRVQPDPSRLNGNRGPLPEKANGSNDAELSSSLRPRCRGLSMRHLCSRQDPGRLKARSRRRTPPARVTAAQVGARPKRAAKADPHERRRRCDPRKEPYAAVDQEGIVVLYKPAFWTVTTTTTASAKEEAALQSRAPRIQTWLTTNLGSQYPFLVHSPRAGLVHRLDVQTSGPILVATNSHTFEEMRSNLHQKTWYKEYIALMHGAVPPKRSTGVLNYKLFTQRDRGLGWRTEVNHKKGEDAETKYEALEAYRCRTLEKGSTQRFTLLRLQLITGRTHQIRVHLAEFARELGLRVRGIVGDYKYLPAEQARADRRLCQRVFLHAQKLHFPPPANKGPLFQVKCPLPPELQRVLSKLERDERTTKQFKEKARREPALPVDHDSEGMGGPTERLTTAESPVPPPQARKRRRVDARPAPSSPKAGCDGASVRETKCKRRRHTQ